jgi:hypothetical protein
MDSNTADQLSHEFESALSAIIPEIAQVAQQYQVSGAFKAKLKIVETALAGQSTGQSTGHCTVINGVRICSTSIEHINAIEILSETLTPELDSERAEQLWTEIASTLSSTVALLGQSVQNTGKSFEVHFFIETATLNSEQPVVCQWDNDISEVNILQCSKP